MLHFPSPVNLTGWNTTGGLLGRKDERLFFFSTLPRPYFPYSPPPQSLSSHDSPSLLSLLLPLVSLCCFHVPCMYTCMGLDSYVMWHPFLMCWRIASVAWLGWAVLTHGLYISASCQPPNPLGHLFGHVTQQFPTISLLQCPRCELLYELSAPSASWR